MVPQVNKRGQSFKGVTAYLMHDKEADTSERVAFTETRNLPFGDVEQASRFMAWTDLNSEMLKHQHEQYTAQLEGREPRHIAGSPSHAGNVYHMSLSWHTSQEPTREQMTQAADDAVARLGLDDHEYYLVAHDDADHSHIHMVVNLVHPVTGKVGDIYKDHDVLDRWANE
ncbi:MAG: relaxase/mobilization nuclease domain-containing protein, partial [Paracoccaceae bacterium]